MSQPKPRTGKCPQCRKSASLDQENTSRPFCSERCRLIDLGAWANEEFAIAGEEAHSSAEAEDQY